MTGTTESDATTGPTRDPPGLSQQLCFDLYAASRAVVQAYRPVLSELGLTYPQYLMLIVLSEKGPCSVGQLCDELQLDYGTLTPLLRRMDIAGLLKRQRHSTDERVVRVRLGREGELLRRHAARIHCDMVDAIGLNPDDFAALQASLRILTARVRS